MTRPAKAAASADPSLRELTAKLDTIKTDLAGMKRTLARRDGDEDRRSEKETRAEIERIASGIEALQSAPKFDSEGFDRLQDELAGLRQSMRSDLRQTVRNEVGGAIAEQLDQRDAASKAREEDIGKAVEQLSRGLDVIGQATVQASSSSAEQILPRVESLTSQLSELRNVVSDLPNTLTINRLEGKLREIADGLQKVESAQPSHFEIEGFAQIESRLDEITRALVAVGMGAEAQRFDPAVLEDAIDLSGLERLEGRMADLMGQVDAIASAQATAAQAAARAQAEAAEAAEIEQLSQQIAALSDRLAGIEQHAETSSRAAARVLSHTPDMSGLEAQLAGLAQRLDAQVANPDAATQGQMAELEGHLVQLVAAMDSLGAAQQSIESRIGAGLSMPDLEPLETRLAGIENSILSAHEDADDAQRRVALEAAQAAAARVAQSLPADRGGAVLAKLAGDVQAVSQALATNDHRSVEGFQAVRHALDVLGERLGTIETGITATQKRVMAVENGMSGNGARLATIEKGLVGSTSRLDTLEGALRNDLDAGTGRLEAAIAALGTTTAMTPQAAPQAVPQAAHAMPVAAQLEMPAPTVAPTLAPSIDPTDAFEMRGAHAPGMQADAFEAADAPIEPGAGDPMMDPMADAGVGTPDIDAIVRRASERIGAVSGEAAESGDRRGGPGSVNDVMAQARRAVQATREEFEKTEGGVNLSESAGGLGAKVRELLSKKAVLATTAAVALIALVLGGYVYSRSDDAPSAPKISAKPVVTSPVSASADFSTDAVAPISRTAGPVREVGSASKAVLPPVPGIGDVAARDGSAELPTIEGRVAALEPPRAGPSRLETPRIEVPKVELPEIEPPKAAPVVEAPVKAPEPAPVEATRAIDVTVPAGVTEAPLREAAERGDRTALYEIATRYSEGRGLKKDMSKAIEWFALSADRGFAPAQYSLGSLLEKGQGSPRDMGRAVALYEKAADKGNARAMHNLAVIKAMGTHGGADLPTATRWFHEAAALGVKDSQFNLGILYGQGMGVPQNLAEAYKWFAIAAKTGDGDAAAKRDEVAGVMDAETLKRAKASVAKWKAETRVVGANKVEIPAEWVSAASNRKAPSKVAAAAASGPAGKEVKRAQAMLNRLGYDVGKPDGQAGPRTRTAVAAFQRTWSLPPTGRLDRATLNALEDANT